MALNPEDYLAGLELELADVQRTDGKNKDRLAAIQTELDLTRSKIAGTDEAAAEAAVTVITPATPAPTPATPAVPAPAVPAPAGE